MMSYRQALASQCETRIGFSGTTRVARRQD